VGGVNVYTGGVRALHCSNFFTAPHRRSNS